MRQVLILIETLFSLLYTTLLKMHPGIFLRNANFMPNNWLKMRKLENDNLLIKNHGYGILMGASAFLKSAAFRAFPVNVKTIAPIQICIKLDTQYGVRGRNFSNKRNSSEGVNNFVSLDFSSGRISTHPKHLRI